MQHSQSAANVNSFPTNGLRMPFAEWLFRMGEGKVPYQARSLAVYAVLFKITENEELAVLCGMDTKGRADKTYNKWKKYLTDNGWVRITASTIGRKTTIEVWPAVKTEPVIFTDAKPRDVRKFYAGKSYARAEQSTDDDLRSPVENTHEHGSDVKSTDASRAPACAQKESSLREDKPLEDNNNTPLTPHAIEAMHQRALEQGAKTKGSAVAKSARAAKRMTGELDGSDGIRLENGKLTITNGRAVQFTNDFPGVDLAAVCDRAAPEVMRANYPTADQASAIIRKWARIAMEQKPSTRRKSSNRFSLDELSDGVDAAYERQFPDQPKQTSMRLTHER